MSNKHKNPEIGDMVWIDVCISGRGPKLYNPYMPALNYVYSYSCMAEKLKNILAQKHAPRSYKESENILTQKLTLAMAQLKRGRRELKRLEDRHKSDKGNVAAPDDNTNKRISELDDILEPTFQNTNVAKKEYEILQLTSEISELNSKLHKLRSFFKPSDTK